MTDRSASDGHDRFEDLADVVFIVGPTAVGKTAVAIEISEALGAEILSVDSRQIYRRLEIGTAKPTGEERSRVAHHLVDFVEPDIRMTAAGFAKAFFRALDEVRGRGMRAVAVGGSGLYVDAVLGRLDPLPPADPEIRRRHREIADSEGTHVLHEMLSRVDPETASRLGRNDFKRISRALEIFEKTGRPLSRIGRQKGRFDVRGRVPMFLLLRQRQDLYRRIDERARKMVEMGLIEEVRRLLDSGVRPDWPAMESVGYREVAEFLRVGGSREELIDRIAQATRRYAKRQMTWFRNRYEGIRKVEIPPQEDPRSTARRILDLLAAEDTRSLPQRG